MKSQLYIPKKIKVGYQKRNDTYTKKLAYVIYFDDTGLLRKEKSWTSWRDKSIDPEEFENTPQSGFVLNKNVSRYNWGHFSSNRSLIRIYDPRGIEFEITTENLIALLMNSDCSKRQLSGEFVYAWHGTELVLLPVNAEEYQNAKDYTKLQATMVSTKDLVSGCSYKTKKQENFVFIGKINWYECPSKYSQISKSRAAKKYFTFINQDDFGKKSGSYLSRDFILKSNTSFLSIKNSDSMVSNYAEILDELKNRIGASKIIDFIFEKTTFNDEPYVDSTMPNSTPEYETRLMKPTYFFKEDDKIIECQIQMDKRYVTSQVGMPRKYDFFGFKMTKNAIFHIPSQSFIKNSSDYSSNYYISQPPSYSREEINKIDFYDVSVKLENGIVKKLQTLWQI